MRNRWIIKESKMLPNIRKFYVCAPFVAPTVPAHALVSRPVIASDTGIHRILALVSRSQIRPPVVATVKIDVINLVARPFSGHEEPRQSVGSIQLPGNKDLNVAVFDRSSSLADPRSIFVLFPSKNASLGVVVKAFPKVIKKFHVQVADSVKLPSSLPTPCATLAIM